MKIFSTDDKAKVNKILRRFVNSQELGQNIGFNHITFTHLAFNYKYKDSEVSFAETCDHNAEVFFLSFFK